MKAILLFNKKVDSKFLYPRDIRNFIMKSLDDQDAADYLGNKQKTGHSQSETVYVKPHSNGFEVVNYVNNFGHMEKLESDIVGKSIKVGKEDVLIRDILWKEEEYIVPTRELTLYKTRTPIILSVNPIEHKIVYNRQKNGTIGEYLKQKIEKITTLQMEQFFGYTPSFDGLEIKMTNVDYITINPHKSKGEERYSQAIFASFVSSHRLPRFIGYQTGLGFGEIVPENIGL